MRYHSVARLAGPRSCAVFLIAVAMTIPSPATAQQQLTFADGDRLSGELVAVQDSNWVFKYKGQDVKLPTAGIQAFTASEPIGIRLTDSTVVAATVRPVADGLLLEMKDGTTRLVQPVDFAAVGSASDLKKLEPVIITLYSPFFKFWKILASLGGSLQRGNTDENNLSFTLDLGRETSKDRTEFAALLTTTKELDEAGETLSTEPRIIVSLGTDIFMTKRLFGSIGGRWQHDPTNDLQFRQTYSGGLGVQIVRSEATGLRASVGVGGRFDNLTTGPRNDRPILTSSGEFNQTLGPARFRVGVTYDPSLEDFSDVELLNSYDISISVFKRLTFIWSLLYQYNNPPPSGDEKNDLTMTYQLGWSTE